MRLSLSTVLRLSAFLSLAVPTYLVLSHALESLRALQLH